MKKRNSGFELLRILCMISIVFYHYAQHGGYGDYSSYDFDAGVFIVQFVNLFGRIACCVFAMISGYFLISPGYCRDRAYNFKEDYRRFIPLFAELHFYYYLILAAFLITGAKWISARMIVFSAFPFFFGTWYIVYYLIFLLFLPFLRNFCLQLSRKNYVRLLALLFIVWSLIPTLTADEVWTFSDMDFFLVMFLVGGFFKLHVKELPARWKRVCALAGFFALLVLSLAAFDFLGVFTGHGVFIDKAIYFEKINSVIGVGLSVSAFMVFLDMEFCSPVINRISAGTLAVYLVHNNEIFRTWYWELFYPNKDYIHSPMLHMIAKVLILFSVCILFDLVRDMTLGNLVRKWMAKHYDNVWNKLSALDQRLQKLI